MLQENEEVVHKALQEVGSAFELEHSLPEWPCRGLPLFPGGEKGVIIVYLYSPLSFGNPNFLANDCIFNTRNYIIMLD